MIPGSSPATQPKSVEVLAITPVRKGALKAFAAVRIHHSLVIKDIRVIQQDGQNPWISPPQREYVAADGAKRYAVIVEWEEPLKGAIQTAVLSAWQGGAS